MTSLIAQLIKFKNSMNIFEILEMSKLTYHLAKINQLNFKVMSIHETDLASLNAVFRIDFFTSQ